MEKESKIYIAGHRGLVGSAIVQNLIIKGYTNLVTRSHEELDLIDCKQVEYFFGTEKPEYVFLAAAKVGGVVANNNYRAQFIFENLMIQSNLIHQSYLHGVKKLLFIGSSGIYPKNCVQPIKEEYLLTGPLEYTNEPYAVAKIAGLKMCESYNLQYGTNFISVTSTSVYGPGDNFDLDSSHVLPAIIRKVHLAKALEENNWEAIAEDLNRRPIQGLDGSQGKDQTIRMLEAYGIRQQYDKNNTEIERLVEVEIWGSGKQVREFLWSEDLADACVFIMEDIDFCHKNLTEAEPGNTTSKRNHTHINIGSGREITIGHLAEIVKIILKFNGGFRYNTEKPTGMHRRLTDCTKLKEKGWKSEVELDEGIYRLYKWYISSIYTFSYNNRR